METGYVTSFVPLQYALMVIVEYVCGDGERHKVRQETIPWDAKWMVWQ
ncbi:hypothetical protein [Burkholderia ubonensis]|nr:hypothetical protein [Burkholderia ubonensis]